MDDVIIGMVGVLVFGIAFAAVLVVTIAINPDENRPSTPKGKGFGDPIDNRDDLVAIGDGEASSWKEAVLDINDNEDAFVIG